MVLVLVLDGTFAWAWRRTRDRKRDMVVVARMEFVGKEFECE